ncbi:MAG: MBL fold metallo-hydrolase [Candidatus Heimdallarchaeota archaeon]|nr:MBL fold metallo-hydrolase [Candidatus Heimdallarchaeota archaeon]
MTKIDPLKLTESIWDYAPSEKSSHISFIDFDSYLVMVDTGMDFDKTKEFRKFAEKTTDRSFKQVIITHYHGDHTFGTNVFKDCEIISTQATRDLLAKKVEGDYKDKNIFLPNKTFSGEYELKEGNKTIKIIETNGHTKGSAFVYLPEEGAILTGDLLFADMFPFAGDETVNPYLWVDAFQKMIDLNPNIVIPGHGHIGSINNLIEGQKKISEMIKFIETSYKQKLTKEEMMNSKQLPDFTKDANDRWLKMTIEAFYNVVEEKYNLLKEI